MVVKMTNYVGVITVTSAMLKDEDAFVKFIGMEVLMLLKSNMVEHDGAPVLVRVGELT